MKRVDMRIAALLITAGLLVSCGGHDREVVAHFRRFTKNDLCAGTEVYAARDERTLLGVLVLEQPIEASDGRELGVAVNLKSFVDGRVVALWRSRSDLMRTFVREDDPAVRDCRWFVQQTPYRLGESDISPVVSLRFNSGWNTAWTSTTPSTK